MLKAGILLDLVSVFIITLVMYVWGTVVFGIDISVFPDWAIPVK